MSSDRAVAAAVRSAPDHGPVAEPPTTDLSRLARLVGTVVAPTTMLTGLLYYFGWSFAYYFFDYFGVNSTLLGLSTRDYLQRCVDGLFVPVTVTGCAALAAVWGYLALRVRLSAASGQRALRVVVPVAAVAGAVLAIGGLLSVFTRTVLSQHLAAAPLSLAIGVLLLTCAIRLRRSHAIPKPATRNDGADRNIGPDWAGLGEWAAVFILVGLSLFWAANDYSAAVGRTRARQFAAELPSYPSAVLYSERSLSLDAPGVREVRCRDAEAAYRFRYEGLKLMIQSGDQYVFLPDTWSPTDGVAILIPRSDSLRLEFVPQHARTSAQRSAC